ncbi:MAG TPA: gamma-glutamyltransferase, partial [Wenzhouxiangella sp.]|nr:gamma-glutamyltransferase [Wenzhouxiangella sp.]
MQFQNFRDRSMISRFNTFLFGLLGLLSMVALAGDEPGRAAISSAHELATAAGVEILEKGGNAFDAAVAVSAALAVVEPESSGIGGGGFWLLHRASDGHSVMVDGRERAPAAAVEDMFRNDDGEVERDQAINGALAGGIPGAAAAWVHIAKKYGTLGLPELLAPAIRLADEGFPVSAKYHTLIGYRAEVMRRWPETAAIFMPGGEVPAAGDIVRNPDLANTLRAVAENGRAGFYSGEVARKLVDGVQSTGGIWTLADFADYEIVEREPVRTSYRGYQLITASPPS